MNGIADGHGEFMYGMGWGGVVVVVLGVLVVAALTKYLLFNTRR